MSHGKRGWPGDLASRFPQRATVWRLRTRILALPRRPLLMGIVNVTPDSFSDGGEFFGHLAAIDRALQLEAEGADLIDIGGESTRPYSQPVSAHEELDRVLPVFQALCGRLRVPLTIDTSKSLVAREALAAGAEAINDITGLTGDADMVDLVAASEAGVCAMHMQGTPATMQDQPTYADVAREVFEHLRSRRDELASRGIARERIALDPGIGFGKTHQHNLTLLAACHELHELGQPILVGHSRKGFIAKVLGDREAPRLFGAIGAALALAVQGVQIIRVHDVRPVREALLLFDAAGGIDGQPLHLDDYTPPGPV